MRISDWSSDVCSSDLIGLHHYLSFHSVVPAPRTILAGVSKLPPATTLAIEPDGRRVERSFWAPAFERDPERADWYERDWEDAVLAGLSTEVEGGLAIGRAHV